MRENIIKIKSFEFAVRVVNLYRFLVEHKREFVLSKQLLRSGTSVGAMVREAEHAESKKDFISILINLLGKTLKFQLFFVNRKNYLSFGVNYN
ncbi:MAG TPA: four helix bundle protein [Brumimicrobium sp.]|nr:four helix bundle protein [Brumimicrobium sp.]